MNNILLRNLITKGNNFKNTQKLTWTNGLDPEKLYLSIDRHTIVITLKEMKVDLINFQSFISASLQLKKS